MAEGLELELSKKMNGFYRRWGKRAFDLLASFVGLALLSPILLLCGLLVRLTSRGPAFFRQVRLGRHGRLFRVFKFRTMQVGAELPGPAVSLPGDARLTPLGNFLRRFKLDEFPQLINVLLGDMSIVGPRPRVPEQCNLDLPEERWLLTVRPGITSYASIYHRAEADYCRGHDDPMDAYNEHILPQKRYLDSDYMGNLSFSLDLKLILVTLLMTLAPGKGQAVKLSFFGLEIAPYGRVFQMVLEAMIFGAAVWLAYWFRYEGRLPEFYQAQMAAFIVLIPAARLASNYVFKIYDMMWRYLSFVDAALLCLSLSLVSVLLMLLRIFMPYGIAETHIFQIPVGVIVMEYLLALIGSLGLRGLRRALYVMNHHYQPLPMGKRHRIVILGAGLSGVGIALEIGRYPHLQLVGFVDDDTTKTDRLISGYRVFGSSELLGELILQHEISDVIVCIASALSDRLQEICGKCRAFGVRVHIIPTVDQMLRSDEAKECDVNSAPAKPFVTAASRK